MAAEVEYALMAGRIYQSTRATMNWLPDLLSLGWWEQRHEINDVSGFEAVSFKKGSEVVISFAGTGSNVDWWANAGGHFGVTTEQLQEAADYYLQIKAANPGAIISFTGHSLGGGLASLMAVFFGERATTFDQAPFRNSASVEVATTLREYLLNQQGYSETDLQGLTNFISAAASGGIPNENNVIDFSVQGEVLSAASGLRIGTPTSLTHGAPDLRLAINLHSQALLAAFLQSDQTAPALHSLQDVTFKLPDVVRMIFDSNLFAHTTARINTTQENFIERLVRHQNGITGNPLTGELRVLADAMLTRFTSDLWKLAQDGGLTMTDNIPGGIFSSPPNDVSNALIAFAMQMYYEDTANATNVNKELFTNVTGGVRFDRADVAANLDDAKGYSLYFQNYLNSTTFTDTERQLMLPLLPILRDWYVQAGPGGMDVVDPHNRGAFMLGSNGADTLTGGSQSDLLVGNAGADQLDGGAGIDTLLGGAGNDILEGGTENDTLDGGLDNDVMRGGAGLDRYISNFGADTIEDSDGRGVVEFHGSEVLLSGLRRTDDPANVFRSADGTITLTKQGTDLVVTGSGPLRIKNFSSGHFGIRLLEEGRYGAATRTEFLKVDRYVQVGNNPDGTPIYEPVYTAFFNDAANDSREEVLAVSVLTPPLGDENNLIYAGGGKDTIISGSGDDQLYGEGEDDILYGGGGQDRVYGGTGDDQLSGDNNSLTPDAWGHDYLDGGEGHDILNGNAGRDILFGGTGHDELHGGGGRMSSSAGRGTISSWVMPRCRKGARLKPVAPIRSMAAAATIIWTRALWGQA